MTSVSVITRLARAAAPRVAVQFTRTPLLAARPRIISSCRCFSSSPARAGPLAGNTARSPYTIGDLDVATYRAVSDSAMDRLTEYLEELVEELDEMEGLDIEYSAGVLTLKLGDKGTYVINKQPPNKQIWLSSPTSGPKRYDYDPTHHVWFYNRDGKRMRDLLNEELSECLGRKVEVDLDDAEM